MSRGRLRCCLRLLRAVLIDDGLQRVEVFEPFGPVLFAERRDVSDAERMRGGALTGEISTRFRLRRSGLADQISAADRLEDGSVVWSIIGPPKRAADNDRLIEISCARFES